MVRVAILDDWFDTLRTLPSFAKLAGHDVTMWNCAAMASLQAGTGRRPSARLRPKTLGVYGYGALIEA
jgi:hypothetical protein